MERIVEGLSRLGCPLVDQIQDAQAFIEETDVRLQLLEWLFDKYDPQLITYLNYRESETQVSSEFLVSFVFC